VNHQPANQLPTRKIAPELLIDFDFFAVKAIDGDLHRCWKQLHAGPDIFYTPRNGGHWVYTRAEDIAAGAQLARVELRVMLQEWLPRIPEFRIANEAGVVFMSGRINSVHNLPLMWSH
jgi:hypothetical protein